MTQPNTTAILRMVVICDGHTRTIIGAWGCTGVRRTVERLAVTGLLYRRSSGRYWLTAAGWAALAYDDKRKAHSDQETR